jgi:TRAP-type C4-dicarboxylate transport system permease small subunit
VISPGHGQHARQLDAIAPAPRRGLLPPAPHAPLAVRALGWLVDWAVVAIGAFMIVLVFVNVVLHVFQHDLAWTIELSELLMVWVTFLGGAAAARRGTHMSITEFLDKLSPRARLVADAVIDLVAAAVLLLLVRYGLKIVDAGWGNQLTVLGWPMSIQYLALPVGAAAMLVFVAWDFAQIVRGKPRAERFGLAAAPVVAGVGATPQAKP